LNGRHLQKSTQVKTYTGSCHCSALGVTYRTALPVEQWPIRTCQCSFCLAHAAMATSDPSGLLTFMSNDPAALQRYRFGLRTSDFLLCTRCGVYVGAQIETGRGAFGIVNIRVLAPAPAGLRSSTPANYDVEDVNRRIARRETVWTPMERCV
jgi:hypothetical protein